MRNLLQQPLQGKLPCRKEWMYVMRCGLHTMILLLLLHPAFAAAQRISIEMENEKLGTILKEVKRQSGYQLFYSNNELDAERRISVKLKDASLELTLKTILGDSFNYKIIDQNIVITPAGKSPIQSVAVLAFETIQIKGKITNVAGEPLVRASVKIKHSPKGTASDQNGTYTITVDNNTAILIFSFTGYQSKEIKVGNQRDINVVLEEEIKELDETVVTGYQSFTNRTAPGVISTLKPEQLTQKGAISVDQMLEGKVAGVAVTGNIGNPGAPPKIRIRGTSSINGDQEPIWVIDGVIWEDPVAVRNRDLATMDEMSLLTMVGGSVGGLNPKDIESINILKDAAATAIYGVRAANGVVVVTTKRGTSGKSRINYSTDLRTSLRPSYNDFNLMNSAERIQLSQDITAAGLMYSVRPSPLGYEGALFDLRNGNISFEEFNSKIKSFGAVNTDWFDLLFRNSFSQNHNISINGGSDNTTYYFSGSMYEEKANAKSSDLTRYTVNARINSQLRKNLLLDIKVGGNIRENNAYHTSINPFNYATRTSRSMLAYNEDGSLAFYNKKNPMDYFGPLAYNILNETLHTGNMSKTREMNAQVSLRYDFKKYFLYEGTAYYSSSTSNAEEWADEHSYYIGLNYRGFNYGTFNSSSPNFDLQSKVPYGGVLKPYSTNSDNYTVRNAFTFNKKMKNRSLLNIMVGTEIRSNKQKGLSQILPGYFPERGGLFTAPATAAYKRAIDGRDALLAGPKLENNVSNNLSLYSAVIYSLKDRYIFNANGRFDGSNKFGKDPQYRYLPTFSAAFKWIVSDESFMDKLMETNLFDFLAVNASYGLQGNIKSNAYPSLVTKVEKVDNFGNPIASVVSLGNPGLRWEKTYSYNLGLEFGLFKRLNMRVDYYQKNGFDLLIDKLVSQVEGRESVLLNAGNMMNRGVELTLSGYWVRTNDFTWRSTLVGGQNTNKITKASVVEPGVANQLAGNAVIAGQAVGTLYAYAFAGLDNAGVPLYYVNDGHNGTSRGMGILNRKLVPLGSVNPTWSGGFDNSLRYKDITLAISLTYSLGGYQRLPSIYPRENNSNFYLPNPEDNYSKEHLNRWRKPGDEAFTNIPVLMDAASAVSYLSGVANNQSTIQELYNNSDLRSVRLNYMRVRALNLNYNLPGAWIKKIAASSASIYLSAQNLWVITADKDKLNGTDPEVLGTTYALPIPKIFNLGINISF